MTWRECGNGRGMNVKAEQGVTVVVTRVVRPGKDAEFAEWAEESNATVARFEGHLATVRLHDDQGLHHLVYLFDTVGHLRAWEDSDDRAELIRRGNRLSEQRRTISDGLNSWFTVPATSTSWKSFVLTWAAVYPILLVLASLVAWLAPGLPQPLQLAISSITLTALLTWVILPRLNHKARPWLFRGAQPTTKRPGPPEQR